MSKICFLIGGMLLGLSLTTGYWFLLLPSAALLLAGVLTSTKRGGDPILESMVEDNEKVS